MDFLTDRINIKAINTIINCHKERKGAEFHTSSIYNKVVFEMFNELYKKDAEDYEYQDFEKKLQKITRRVKYEIKELFYMLEKELLLVEDWMHCIVQEEKGVVDFWEKMYMLTPRGEKELPLRVLDMKDINPGLLEKYMVRQIGPYNHTGIDRKYDLDEIAKKIGASSDAIQKALNSLIKKGLVELRDGGEEFWFHLTKNGEKEYEKDLALRYRLYINARAIMAASVLWGPGWFIKKESLREAVETGLLNSEDAKSYKNYAEYRGLIDGASNPNKSDSIARLHSWRLRIENSIHCTAFDLGFDLAFGPRSRSEIVVHNFLLGELGKMFLAEGAAFIAMLEKDKKPDKKTLEQWSRGYDAILDSLVELQKYGLTLNMSSVNKTHSRFQENFKTLLSENSSLAETKEVNMIEARFELLDSFNEYMQKKVEDIGKDLMFISQFVKKQQY